MTEGAPPLVASARTTNPIDLTATLVRARLEQDAGQRRQVHWYLEPQTTQQDAAQLRRLAARLAPWIDVEVMPVSAEAEDLGARSLIGAANELLVANGGSVIVPNGGIADSRGRDLPTELVLTHFELTQSGMRGRRSAGDRESVPIPTRPRAVGAGRLLILDAAGEICHLPWYVTADGLGPRLSVQEVIRPVEHRSPRGYSRTGESILSPSGYGLRDFLPNPAADSAHHDWYAGLDFLASSVPPSNSRNIPNPRSLQPVFEMLLHRLESRTICQELSVLLMTPAVRRPPTANEALKMLTIVAAACRVLEAREREHPLSPWVDGSLRAAVDAGGDKQWWTVLHACFEVIRQSAGSRIADLDQRSPAPGRFGELRVAAANMACNILYDGLRVLFRDEKATIAALLQATRGPSELMEAIDRLIARREIRSVSVEGGILRVRAT